jgi:V/A-type H+-transporting ATPase subunit B
VVTLRAEGVKLPRAGGDHLALRHLARPGHQARWRPVSLQVFAGLRGVATDARVRFLGRPMQVPFSDDLMGRIFTGGAEPRDNGPALATT